MIVLGVSLVIVQKKKWVGLYKHPFSHGISKLTQDFGWEALSSDAYFEFIVLTPVKGFFS